MRKEQPINDHVKRKLQNWRKDMREEDLPHLFVPRSTYTTFVRFGEYRVRTCLDLISSYRTCLPIATITNITSL